MISTFYFIRPGKIRASLGKSISIPVLIKAAYQINKDNDPHDSHWVYGESPYPISQNKRDCGHSHKMAKYGSAGNVSTAGFQCFPCSFIAFTSFSTLSASNHQISGHLLGSKPSLLHMIGHFSQKYITQHRFGINQDKKPKSRYRKTARI